MAIKPILFNTEMVRAILDGRKTCTRRLPRKQIEEKYIEYDEWVQAVAVPGCTYLREKEFYTQYPPYQPGDLLYVRETWHRYTKRVGEGGKCHLEERYGYKASIKNSEDADEPWRPSIHMPKDAARIWLKATDVRVERLQEITEDGAKAEGAIDNRGFIHSPENEYDRIHTAREHFIEIWDSTIKRSDLDRYGWAANPYVFVIEFLKIDKPEEAEHERK